jgi:p-methyltransferase
MEFDCVLVGYNERDFDAFAKDQKVMANHSGAYQEVKTNSALVEGRRITHVDAINRALAQITGRPSRLSTFKNPSLGACYLTSFLRRQGHRVGVTNYFSTSEPEDLLAKLAAGTRAVAITTTYYVDNAPVAELVRFIREHSADTKIIVGGPHMFNLFNDYDPKSLEAILKKLGADVYITDSQGEATLGKVVSALKDGGDLSKVPNLVYRAGKEMIRTEREIEDNDLDETSIDWTAFDPAMLRPTVFLRTARSCPFACTFCNYPTMAGEHVVSSVDSVIKQLEQLKAMGTTSVAFVDDTFNVPLPRFKKLLKEMIARKLDMNWVSFFRCSNADDEAFDLMQESGCLGVFLGIESGDQTILNYMEKFARTDKYKEGIRKLNERGVITYASFIVGFPGESDETINNTFRFIEEAAPTYFNLQLYYHDMRSPIAKRHEQFGIKNGGYSWAHNTMSWREGSAWVERMYAEAKNSTPLCSYGLTVWAIPYLLAQGMSREEVRASSEIFRQMMVATYSDATVDHGLQEWKMRALLAPPARAPAAEAVAAV